MTDPTLFSRVKKPGRYLGNEFNSITKDNKQPELSCALIFPDLYEIGMSNQGLQILYHILNKEKYIQAERCYCPDKDLEAVLRSENRPLCSLETAKPLSEFDVLALQLPYELCYTNILTVLDLVGIPFYAKDRDNSFPILLGGGTGAMNPEPVADFFDAILLGDGEEAIIEISDCIVRGRKENLSKQALLLTLSEIEGIYIPSFFEPQYSENGHIAEIRPVQGKKREVKRRILPDLNDIDHLLNPIVPNAKTVHDRLGVEVARGCTRGCRFCQAGITYRPARERSPEQIFTLANKGIKNSGFEELALLSLSTGDYSCLNDVLPKLMDRFANDYVSVALPSMRVGTLTPEIIEQIRRVRKTGFTVAPEAGSERLRRVINKGVTEEDLLDACSTAFSLGWNLMKFYFMIGLPTETEKDIDEIVELVKKSNGEINKVAHGKKQINVSVGTFVPKPHTPFQWSRQISIEESRNIITRLKKNLPRRGCKLKWHDPEQSFLEGVFSRGDRRLTKLIETAWGAGARLDSWSDHFNLSRWMEAANRCNLDLEYYLRERQLDEILPWHHLQAGASSEFLIKEWQDALKESYTPDCRYHGCQQCGTCDFETIKPVVHSNKEPGTTNRESISPEKEIEKSDFNKQHQDIGHFKYMVQYNRTGNMAFLGHLEILQLIFRALRRANITTNYSQGFNPSPKVSFGPALPVGTTSYAEFFVMDLPKPLDSLDEAVKTLSKNLPAGIEVTSICLHSGTIPQSIMSRYTIGLISELTEEQRNRVDDFATSNEFIITRERKGKKKKIDIRSLISFCTISDETTIELETINTAGSPSIKPSEAIQHILQIEEQQALAATFTKMSWRENP